MYSPDAAPSPAPLTSIISVSINLSLTKINFFPFVNFYSWCNKERYIGPLWCVIRLIHWMFKWRHLWNNIDLIFVSPKIGPTHSFLTSKVVLPNGRWPITVLLRVPKQNPSRLSYKFLSKTGLLSSFSLK